MLRAVAFAAKGGQPPGVAGGRPPDDRHGSSSACRFALAASSRIRERGRSARILAGRNAIPGADARDDQRSAIGACRAPVGAAALTGVERPGPPWLCRSNACAGMSDQPSEEPSAGQVPSDTGHAASGAPGPEVIRMARRLRVSWAMRTGLVPRCLSSMHSCPVARRQARSQARYAGYPWCQHWLVGSTYTAPRGD